MKFTHMLGLFIILGSRNVQSVWKLFINRWLLAICFVKRNNTDVSYKSSISVIQKRLLSILYVYNEGLIFCRLIFFPLENILHRRLFTMKDNPYRYIWKTNYRICTQGVDWRMTFKFDGLFVIQCMLYKLKLIMKILKFCIVFMYVPYLKILVIFLLLNIHFK